MSKDRVVSDGVRVHILGQRMFRKPMKDADLITYKQAKQLAMEMFYDFRYRIWREKEMELHLPKAVLLSKLISAGVV